MSKIRPGRIVKSIFTKKSDISVERLEECHRCPLKSKLPHPFTQCTVCTCVVAEKTKVMVEHCPENKWKDIKKMKGTGIKIGVTDTEKYNIDEMVNSVNITLKEPQKRGVPAKIEVRVVNDRAGKMGEFSSDTFDLTNIFIKPGCGGCTKIHKYPIFLKEGEDFVFEIEYDNKALGEFRKSVSVMTKQVNFTIQIQGKTYE